MEAGELRNDIELLKSREQTITALFNGMLNRPPESSVFTGEISYSDSLAVSLAHLPDSLASNNPMLTMLDLERQSFAARKRMVTAMGYPMVGLGLDYAVIGRNEMSTSSMNGEDMIMPMISVTLPIYRKKYLAMQKEADLLGQAASMNYQSTANALQSEYYEAVQMYRDAQRRVKLYENQYDLASRSLELILKSYSVSASGLTDVLRLQQQSLGYELKLTEAVADFNTSVAWLKRLTGNSQMQ
ncbi:MAG: TolC family protein [Marinilabiliales bacterium]|nr:TolC family protein [Marinilabiliales bacterium]